MVMKIIENKVKQNRDLVNPLVEQAFGEGFRGDYVPSEYDPLQIMEGLYLIGKEKVFRFTYAGSFEYQGNGSKLEIVEEFREQAKKYAQLYEAKTGKKVTIQMI
ncbi:Uncharacterised protein [uncultured archaeon]|nr:Uncharacterised protein [uncultured archaeon]